MHIRVAHSPDSDDAFMFYGLAAGAVQAGDLRIEQVLGDIESLNRAAFEGRYEVTAISFGAYPYLQDRYALLPHGASLGDQYGPVLVSTRDETPASLEGLRIAVPGEYTSAYLTLRMYDASFTPVQMHFDAIQQAVLAGEVDAGLLIHEGQLTYAGEGLRKIVDLGEWWFERTGGLPLPLGGNAIRRDLGPEVIGRVSAALHASIAHALSHRDAGLEYALTFGRGLDAAKTDRFIGMYVNGLTLDYGARGRAAVERFFAEAWEKRLIPAPAAVDFAG